jgi:hypothetical protein
MTSQSEQHDHQPAADPNQPAHPGNEKNPWDVTPNRPAGEDGGEEKEKGTAKPGPAGPGSGAQPKPWDV